VRGDTLHVPADHPTIQSCIDAAVSGQDECLVSPGTYYERIDLLGKAIAVRSASGPAVTTIDGFEGTVVNFRLREGRDTVLEGFTITGGGWFAKDRAGGMEVGIDAAPTITNCIFRGNTAGLGGGMFLHNYSAPLLTDCIFTENTATYASIPSGGAIYLDYSASLTLMRCTFSNNSAHGGGAIYNNYGNMTLTDCTFSGNTAFGAGAVYSSTTDTQVATFNRCTFTGNSAGSAGGIFIKSLGVPTVVNQCIFIGNVATQGDGGALLNWVGSPTIIDSTFVENTAASSSPRGNGGGIYNYLSNPHISGCVFLRNTASEVGGGVSNSLDSSPTITDCTFIGNSARDGGATNSFPLGDVALSRCIFQGNTAAQSGGAMFNDGGRPTIDNCLYVGNTSHGLPGGAAMFSQFAAPRLYFTTFAGNFGDNGAAVISNLGSSPTFKNCILWNEGAPEMLNGAESRPTFYANDIQGGLPAGAVDVGQNFDKEPAFVRAPYPGLDGNWDGLDDDYGDLRLQPGSPCISAGNHNMIEPGAIDLDLNPRSLCRSVGSYEFGLGDPSCDGVVDLYEFGVWSECATDPQRPYEIFYCRSFDSDVDGDVDLADLAQFYLVFNP
jgi:parallel beta-helix repeat protein